VIVLSAAYMDAPLARAFAIDPEHLRGLIRKTLDFVAMHSQPSSALAQDIKMLEYMSRRTGLVSAPRKLSESAAGSVAGPE
jgi:hypothetical protein